MTDKIDRFLGSLSNAELAECKARIDELTKRSRGRPRGKSKADRHIAHRMIAFAALRAKRDWLDANPERNRVPDRIVQDVIDGEMQKHGLSAHSEKDRDAILNHVRRRIRVFLPARSQ